MPLSMPSIDQMQANQYNQDTQLQNFYNQNAQNATNQYNTAYNASNQAQSDLTNFTKNMVSGNDAYQKQLQLANQNAGYDVNNLNQAQNQVSQLTGILGGLPRAIQASNANYGATAGNVANQYATTGANLNQSLQLANQNAANQLAKQQGGLTGAQQGTQAVMTAQDQQRQAYTSAANNAAQIMDTAQKQMQAMVAAQQNGQQLTANDQNTFAQLRQAYAAAAQAYAVARYNNAQADQTAYALSQQRAADQAAAAKAEAAQKVSAQNQLNSMYKPTSASTYAQQYTNDLMNKNMLNFGSGGFWNELGKDLSAGGLRF